MGFWTRLRAFRIFFQLVRDPNRTDLIFKGIALASKDVNQEALKAIERHVLAHSEFHAMYAEKYIPENPQMKTLAEMPEESFGRAVYHHMRNNNLGFEIFPRLELHHPINYLSTRIYQDHDLWHVLLGCGVEVEDELAVQAFGVVQYQSPIATMIIAGGILHLLGKNPSRAVDAFKRINENYLLGKKAKFLLSVRLHDLFPRSLTEVREICGIA